MPKVRWATRLALPAVMAVAMTACTVPDAMRVREGIHPKNQDENVRFRTTYYFRVFDACSDRDIANGKSSKGRDRIITDALYRFRMTGKANALSTNIRFESGTLRRQEIDPFGATVAFESGTGQPRFRSRQETEALSRRKIDQDHIRGLIEMKRELEASKDKNLGALNAMTSKISAAINALPASLSIPSSGSADVRDGATGARRAVGSIRFLTKPTPGHTIKINGMDFPVTANEIGADLHTTVGRIAAALKSSKFVNIKQASYEHDGGDGISVTYRGGGIAGNAFSLPGAVKGQIETSGNTLTGGRDGGLCDEGMMARRGFQILGPEGWRTFDQDERLIMAMGTSAAPLIATLQEISSQVLNQGPNRGEMLLPLVQERLKISQAQGLLLGHDPDKGAVDIGKIIAILEGK
jgi:hypothetical protein